MIQIWDAVTNQPKEITEEEHRQHLATGRENRYQAFKHRAMIVAAESGLALHDIVNAILLIQGQKIQEFLTWHDSKLFISRLIDERGEKAASEIFENSP